MGIGLNDTNSEANGCGSGTNCLWVAVTNTIRDSPEVAVISRWPYYVRGRNARFYGTRRCVKRSNIKMVRNQAKVRFYYVYVVMLL